MRKYWIVLVAIYFTLLTGCKMDTKKSIQTNSTQNATKVEEMVEENGEVYIRNEEGEYKRAERTNPTKKQAKELSQREIIENAGVAVNAQDISFYRSEAKKEIDRLWKSTNKKSYIIIDNQLFEYTAILGSTEMTPKGYLDGYWIDYSEDLTYTYGYYDKLLGKGIYAFDIESMVITMLDNAENKKPQSFELKIANDTAIFIGRSAYNDNNMQGKMVRVEKRPSKG